MVKTRPIAQNIRTSNLSSIDIKTTPNNIRVTQPIRPTSNDWPQLIKPNKFPKIILYLGSKTLQIKDNVYNFKVKSSKVEFFNKGS